ncbi:hypothetical protein PPYR_00551 [Photinus pyralis]|uniref:Uncharacterized protein n=1 Tax=Photinus pyralis TaxID=7054 RepID=A0A5N4B1U6_PHOPY|nr:hypothetical protein PPYR_00551 [Photinus pyralis]
MLNSKFLAFAILMALNKQFTTAHPIFNSESDSDPISIAFSIYDLGGFGSREWRDSDWYNRHVKDWKRYDEPPYSYWDFYDEYEG